MIKEAWNNLFEIVKFLLFYLEMHIYVHLLPRDKIKRNEQFLLY